MEFNTLLEYPYEIAISLRKRITDTNENSSHIRAKFAVHVHLCVKVFRFDLMGARFNWYNMCVAHFMLSYFCYYLISSVGSHDAICCGMFTAIAMHFMFTVTGYCVTFI